MVLETYNLNGEDTIDIVKVKRGGNIRICIVTKEGETTYTVEQPVFRDLLVNLYVLSAKSVWDTKGFDTVNNELTHGFGMEVEFLPYLPESPKQYPQILFRTKYTPDLIIDVPVLEQICSDLLKFVEHPMYGGIDHCITNAIISEMLTSSQEG